MKEITRVELVGKTTEEALPWMTAEFPCISTYNDFGSSEHQAVPWHWHKEIELFYVKEGSVCYYTPHEKISFPAGTGGFVNTNVLHRTEQDSAQAAIQYLHLFGTTLIGGEHGSRIEQKYVLPITRAHNLEIIKFDGKNETVKAVLKLLEATFTSTYEENELMFRNALGEIWMHTFSMAKPFLNSQGKEAFTDDKIKVMMSFIQNNIHDKLSIPQVAEQAYVSERECYRLFRNFLDMSPVEYINACRLQKSYDLLKENRYSLAQVAQECGFSSSSYFGKMFQRYYGKTPAQMKNSLKQD